MKIKQAHLRLLLPLPVAWGLNGCAGNFALKRVAPSPEVAFQAAATSSADQADEFRLAAANERSLCLLSGSRSEHNGPALAQARREAAESLLNRYSPALLRTPRHSLLVPLPEGHSLRLRLRCGVGPGGIAPDKFVGLEPTDHFVVKTRAKIVQVSGVGVPLVGTLRPVAPVSAEHSSATTKLPGMIWAVTAVPVPQAVAGGRPVLQTATLDFDLYNPYLTERIKDPVNGTSPLAADFTTPTAVAFAHFGPQRRGLRGFLNGGGDDFNSTGIYTYEQPSTDKIPLVLVHGLVSDPTTFHLLHDQLEGDAVIRRRYQACFFYYPSSLPVPYSAMLLREDLEKFIHQLDPGGTHPALHRAVLIGHSMGGMLNRLVVSHGGDKYYRHFFRRPLDELQLTSNQRDLMRRMFYYQACPDVAQVIFIATPHRGSKLAVGLLGNIGRLLVRLPLAARARIGSILANNRAAIVPGVAIKSASSMNSLSPRDPLIEAINDLSMRPGLGLNSIIGNRGQSGPLESSSDGAVPYTSSHLEQAQSEVVVPANHTGALARPETVAEIIRVLRLASPDRSMKRPTSR